MTPEVDRIKQELRDARTEVELDVVRHRNRALVQDMMESATLHVMAIQITNLANYRRKELRRAARG
ncbi:MAG: hypothetical protein GYB50_03780 [Rhodobacteraceae bacterium]|nr:hypothetical protein [Paracoccaceae bacterium]